MKFLIVGDLHGHMPLFSYSGFDAIIAPGDFCSDAPRKFMFEALRKQIDDPHSKVQWYDLTGKTKARQMIKKSLADGRVILEKLNSFGVPVYITPGNWDWTAKKEDEWDFLHKDYYQGLVKGLKNIVDVHHRLVDARDAQFIGHGITSGPEYPQNKKDLEAMDTAELKNIKRKYEQQKRKVAELFLKAKKPKPILFMSHNVPYNTPIDLINNPSSPRNGEHFGSLIAREMIDRFQPLVCVGGHMHEHFTSCKLGKTVCINAGFGSWVNVWLEIKKNEIKTLEFHRATNERTISK